MCPVTPIWEKMHLGIKENGTYFEKKSNGIDCIDIASINPVVENSTVLSLALMQRGLKPPDFTRHPGGLLGLLLCALSQEHIPPQLLSYGFRHYGIRAQCP